MEFIGTTTSYKCIGNEDNKTRIASMSQIVSDESHSIPNRKYNSAVLYCRNGAHQRRALGIWKRIDQIFLNKYKTPLKNISENLPDQR